MTVNELVAKLAELGLPGDYDVRVSAMGGMRHGKPISSVSVGFDFDAGAVILHPQQALVMEDSDEREERKIERRAMSEMRALLFRGRPTRKGKPQAEYDRKVAELIVTTSHEARYERAMQRREPATA